MISPLIHGNQHRFTIQNHFVFGIQYMMNGKWKGMTSISMITKPITLGKVNNIMLNLQS